jgi:hypothetical protein
MWVFTGDEVVNVDNYAFITTTEADEDGYAGVVAGTDSSVDASKGKTTELSLYANVDAAKVALNDLFNAIFSGRAVFDMRETKDRMTEELIEEAAAKAEAEKEAAKEAAKAAKQAEKEAKEAEKEEAEAAKKAEKEPAFDSRR